MLHGVLNMTAGAGRLARAMKWGMIAGENGREKERQATRDDEGLISSTSPWLISILLATSAAAEMEIEEEGALSQRRRHVDCRLQVK